MKVAVIGAGPSGLVTLKTLLASSTSETPISVRLFEAEDKLGGTFRYRSYENAELVSSRQLTAFSDFRFPANGSDHLSLDEYCQHLEDYADHFKLRPHMTFGAKVVEIRRGNGGKGHIVTYTSKFPPVTRVDSGILKDDQTEEAENQSATNNLETYECDAIAICSGLHVEPSIPTLPGIAHVLSRGGQAIHSSEYKSRSQLTGKRVLVLGCGETAMDIAYESIQANAEEVTMCHRNGFLSFPKVLNDFEVFGVTFDGKLPIDGIITNLFENAYVHPWVKATRLRWFVSDFFIKRLLWFLTGTPAGCSQWVGELPSHRLGRAYTFLNKSTKAMPYINRPFKKPYLTQRFARYHDPKETLHDSRVIHLRSFPEGFDETGAVIFSKSERKEEKMWSGKVCRPNLVVFATGYEQNFKFLKRDGEGAYPTASEANVREVYKQGDETVGFIGFVRPGV
ncbi:hypothetical protein HK104_005072, partial [Borealophlyctis nickersoniae]